MGIKSHYLEDSNGNKFYPYAHANATFDENGVKVGVRLNEIETAIITAKSEVNTYTDKQISAEVTERNSAIAIAKSEANAYTDEKLGCPLGNTEGKTIPEFQNILVEWIKENYNKPNARTAFWGSLTHVYQLWNNNDTTTPITKGSVITVEMETYFNDTTYALLKLTNYAEKQVYYALYKNSTWYPINHVAFDVDLDTKLDKYCTNLGSMKEKTIPEFQTILNDWVKQNHDIANARATFTGDIKTLVSLWNNNNTTSTIPAGVSVTAEIDALYSGSDYILIKLTTYFSKGVWYVTKSKGEWLPIYKVTFDDDLQTGLNTKVSKRANGHMYNDLASCYSGSTYPTYYRIVFPDIVTTTWSFLTIEITIRQKYESGLSGKIIISARHNNTDPTWNIKASTLGNLTEDIKVYGSDGRYLYIAGCAAYTTISIDKILAGDKITTEDISDTIIDVVSELPETYQTATMYYGLHSGNFITYCTPANIGLGNVDNTSDKNKPVSTAQQTAINSAVSTAKSEANTYTDNKMSEEVSARNTAISTHNTSTSAHNDIRDLVSGLTNRLNALADSDDTTLDQMHEVVEYIKANRGLIESITTTKVNVSDIVNNLTTNVSNKPLSASQGVAIKALIDALQTDIDNHVADTTKHITSTERTNWNAAKNHADTAHAPSNAQANQNAFSNVKVGDTTIAADTTTDTLTLVGSNVTVTPDVTNDKVTIGITKANVTAALGYIPASESNLSTQIDNQIATANTTVSEAITDSEINAIFA